MTKSFLCDNCGFLDVGHPLWREGGSVIYSYNCFWALAEQSLLGRSIAELTTMSVLLSGGPGPHIYIPKEQGGPVIPPGTGFLLSPLTTRRATEKVF
jgi:hypothetical protein